MARINRIFASGTIANVIFYELNGTPCARSKPAHVRQTDATRIAGKQFGAAKTLSRLLRQAFSGLLPLHAGKPVMYLVDSSVRPWIQTIQTPQQGLRVLPGFPCTPAADIKSLFRKEINTQLHDNTIIITIPAKDNATVARHPADATKGILSLAVATINLQQSQLIHYDQRSIEIPFPLMPLPSQVFSFDAVTAPGNIIAVAAGIRYVQEKDGKTVVVDKEEWQAMHVLQGWYCE